MSHIERDIRGEYLAPDVTPEDPRAEGYCEICGGIISEGDYAYEKDDTLQCEDCWNEYERDTRKQAEKDADARLGRTE
jgi:hypothetical protein